MKTNSARILVVAFIFILAGMYICATKMQQHRQDDAVSAQVGVIQMPAEPTILPLPPESAAETQIVANNNYKLVVGANLTVNTNQKLSPPTGSVVITGGEEQLRELREQARKTH